MNKLELEAVTNHSQELLKKQVVKMTPMTTIQLQNEFAQTLKQSQTPEQLRQKKFL